MDTVKRRRRISSIPKLPDDDSDEIITTMPPPISPINEQDKILPPLPITIGQQDGSQSNLSISSSNSTNRSLALSTSLKSNAMTYTDTTNVNSSDMLSTAESSETVNHQLQKLKHEETGSSEDMETDVLQELNSDSIDNENSNGGVGSFLKNITGYGIQRSQSVKNSLSSKTGVANHQRSISSVSNNSYTLSDGIRFDSENGTEMLSYRKTRSASNKNPASDATPKQSGRVSGPPANVPKNRLASPQSSLNSPYVGTTSPVVPTPPKVEVDYNLYVDEKYLDTQYRYAVERRNTEFHQLFSDVPENDRLLDDFSCALSKEILLQGRLYVSEHYLCFNSSLLGWVTTFVVSLDEIQKFERRSTVGLFPNGIIIETREARHIFANFITRDQTLNFLETVWSKSISLSKKNNEKSREFESLYSKTSFEGLSDKKMKLLSEDDIYTIDGDSSSDLEKNEEETDGDDSESEKEESEKIQGEEKVSSKDKGKQEKSVVEKLFPGPKRHSPSTFKIDYDETKENIVLEKEYDLPLGLLYEIFFGKDISFHKNMMVLNDGLNFTEYTGLSNEGEERTFEYDKKLNYPIGPSSTRVYCTERVQHMDFEDYVEILNISKTPNVPSGTAFDCRTRYLFTWAEQNRSKLIISFKLEWTGGSWFKGIIESSALSGQQKAADDVNTEMLKVIPQKIIDFRLNDEEENQEVDLEADTKSMAETIVEKAKNESQQPTPQTAAKATEPDLEFLGAQIIKTPVGAFEVRQLLLVLFAIIIIQLVMITNLRVNIKEQTKILKMVSERLQRLEKSPI